jgi:hypothetical protein
VLTDRHVPDPASSSQSIKAPKEMQRYEQQLDHLTQTINGLLDGLDSVARDVNIAKDTQEKLYSAHHKVRSCLISLSLISLSLLTSLSLSPKGTILSEWVCVVLTVTKSLSGSQRAAESPQRDSRSHQNLSQIAQMSGGSEGRERRL